LYNNFLQRSGYKLILRKGVIAFLLNFKPQFTLTFFTLHFYPYCLKMKTHFTPTPLTALHGVKEENFPLLICPYFFWNFVNIPLFAIIFQQHFNKNMNKIEIWTAI